MSKRLIVLLWGVALVLLAGCTMRPPSAGAFMSAYQSRENSHGMSAYLSLSKYTASTSDSAIQATENEHSISVWEEVVEEETSIDFTLSFFHFINHFGFGYGLQFLNPYITLGAAFDHFGIMGWTDWRLIAVCDGYPDALRGGISVMEQILPTPNLSIGLFQFASRTEAMYAAGGADHWVPYKEDDLDTYSCWDDDTDCYWKKEKSDFSEPYYYGFIEYGGGAYVMYNVKSWLSLGFEFRYSYDITYKATRLAFTLDAFFGQKQ